MKAIRVRVENGRITGEELARLNAALARGFASIEAGRFRGAADVISDLRRR